MIKLRPYQQEVIEKIRSHFKKNSRQYVQMPTGAGKTITFLSYGANHHKKILIVVPSKELLNQVYESAQLFYHKNEISRKGNRFEEYPRKLHICIINSIRGDYLETILMQGFDLVVIDEAHHSQANSYRRLIDNLSNETKLLGVTATPDRIDGKLIDEVFLECTFRIETLDLIEKNYLSDIEGYCVKTKIDISDVDDHNGDFSLGQLYQKLATEERNNTIVDHLEKNLKDRKTLIFCINVKHSHQINDLIKQRGISSAHIDGKMNADQRNVILKAFREGEISVLCNCQLLSEGFDEPSIDGIILARPTKSRSLFNQMIGRGLRIYPGKKNCKIIDIVDNHRNISGFNSILDDNGYPEIETFSSIRNIKDHIEKQRIQLMESRIEKVNLLNSNRYEDLEPTESMIEYLRTQEIQFFEPLSFDEASFLIWLDKLKKEYANGIHQKKSF